MHTNHPHQNPLPDFHVMLKPRGPICNLNCAYCYYLAKEQLYPGSPFRMPDDLLEEYTRQYIQARPIPEVTFAWQGGEPTLMGLDFFRRAVALQEQYRPPGMTITNALQTNAVNLDNAWCAFFKEHNFLVGVSLDGPREIHDTYRLDKGGKPTFKRVITALKLLKKHRVQVNILTTVHAANADHPIQVYRFLRDEVGAAFIQFIPIVEPDGDVVSTRSVTARQYGDFLIAVFDEWVRRDVGRVFVQIFDVALAAWMDYPPGLCVFQETCGDALVMEHNGDVYACDHFVEPHYLLGNITQEPLAALVTSQAQRRFGQAKRDTLPRYCRQCEVRFVCNGGCPKDRLITTPDGEPGLNYLCAAYKAFFTHAELAMRFMAAELRAHRPPANVMNHVLKQDAARRDDYTAVGRNDPCPCGSGRKYKHCHGRSSE